MSGEKLKLNLGCGSRQRPGFLNVDAQAGCRPDLVLDLEATPWPWADDAADEIDLIHVLEHLGQAPAVYLAIMRELWRVCCNGARVRIVVPHPRSDEFLNDPTHVRPITAAGLEMFSQRRNAEWETIGAANTPLGSYLGIDFEIESSALDLRPVWQTRLQNGEVTEEDVWRAGEQNYNVFSQLTVILRAVKPAGRGLATAAAAQMPASPPPVAVESADTAAHSAIGDALASGDVTGALALATAALAKDADNLEARAQLATAQHAAGHLEAARNNFRQCASKGFGGLELYNNLGVVALELSEYGEAVAAFEAALAHDSQNPVVRENLAEAFGAAGRIQDAVAIYERLLQESPQTASIYLGIARLFNAQGWFADALGTLDLALDFAGNDPELLNQKGIALREQGRHEAALAAFDAALVADPGNANLTANRAAALARLGRDEEAEAALRAVLAVGGSTPAPEAAFALACFLLQRGRTDEGWHHYDARRRMSGICRHPLEDSLPVWRGEAVPPDARLLVVAEQGFGDNLQFARLLPQVTERFAGGVCLQTRPALLTLLQRSLTGICEVVDALADGAHFDFVCPIASLPRALSLSVADWGMATPYLKTDAMQAALWGFRIPAGPRRKVGFCRSGGKSVRFRHRCDLPLPQAERLLACADIAWISLQKDGDEVWRQAQVAAGRLIDLMPQSRSFDDTASLVANLDLVITVDTSVAHLAGALGKPVWLLLDHDADWRWLTGRDDSPWYPSMRLFRQTSPGDWEGVATCVAAALASGSA